MPAGERPLAYRFSQVSEDCLQTFVAVKVDRAFVSFDHCERSVAIYFTVRQLPLPAVAP